MGFLLMPSDLLKEAIEGCDLLSWPTLYRLRDRFQVDYICAEGQAGETGPSVRDGGRRLVSVSSGVRRADASRRLRLIPQFVVELKPNTHMHVVGQ